MKPDVHIAMSMDDGSLATLAFKTEGRSPTLPNGATWLPNGNWHRPATTENIEDELNKAFPGLNTRGVKRPKVVSWRIISVSELPFDRSYRNAWEDKAGMIVHNIEKAKELHRERIRRRRRDRLIQLDVDYQRADERNDAQLKQGIVAAKQRLRDATTAPEIENAQTIAQLKAAWPPDLER